MESTEQTVGEAHELSRLLVLAADLAKADLAGVADAHEVPVALARALVQLGEPAPMRDLAERLDCDKSYVTGLARKLEERGLIERVVGEDQRQKLLTVTPQGAALRQRLMGDLAGASLVTRKLNQQQRHTLRGLLQVLTARSHPKPSRS